MGYRSSLSCQVCPSARCQNKITATLMHPRSRMTLSASEFIVYVHSNVSDKLLYFYLDCCCVLRYTIAVFQTSCSTNIPMSCIHDDMHTMPRSIILTISIGTSWVPCLHFVWHNAQPLIFLFLEVPLLDTRIEMDRIWTIREAAWNLHIHEVPSFLTTWLTKSHSPNCISSSDGAAWQVRNGTSIFL